jgi:hypothetical protein
MDLQYQRGQFHTLYAKMKIRLGGTGPNGVPHNIAFEKGDTIQYDGSVLKYAGMELPVGPSMRSSINQGWFTDDPEEIDNLPEAVIPTRNVAKSQTKNTDLQRVQRRDDVAMETDHHDEDTVMNVSDRRPDAHADQHNPGGRNIRAEPRKITAATMPRKGFKSKGLVINPGEIEEQDYTPVARLRTSAKAKVDMYSPEAGQLKHKLDNLSGSGAIPLRQRQREETFEQEGVTIRTTAKMPRNAEVEIAQENEGTVVGKVRHSSKKATGNAEGISVTDTSNIREERAAAKKNAKSAGIDTKVPPKIRLARSIDPSFPLNWSFDGKLKDRLAAAKKHGATPVFLEALYAAEGDQMRKMLEKTFPKQFGG